MSLNAAYLSTPTRFQASCEAFFQKPGEHHAPGVFIGWLLDSTGGSWSTIFTLLGFLSLASAGTASLLWNARPKGAPKK